MILFLVPERPLGGIVAVLLQLYLPDGIGALPGLPYKGVQSHLFSLPHAVIYSHEVFEVSCLHGLAAVVIIPVLRCFEEHGILAFFGNRHAKPLVVDGGAAGSSIGDLRQHKLAEPETALLQWQAQVKGKFVVAGFDIEPHAVVLKTELLVAVGVKVEIAVHERKFLHQRPIGIAGILLREHQDIPEIILAVEHQVRKIFPDQGDVFGSHAAEHNVGSFQLLQMLPEERRTQQGAVFHRQVVEPGAVFLFVEVDKKVFGLKDRAHLLFAVAFPEIERGLHLRLELLHMHPREDLLFVHVLKAQQHHDACREAIELLRREEPGEGAEKEDETEAAEQEDRILQNRIFENRIEMDDQVIAQEDPEQEELLFGKGNEFQDRYKHQHDKRRKDQLPAKAAAKKSFDEIPDLGIAGRREPAPAGRADAADGKLVKCNRQVRQVQQHGPKAGQQVAFPPFPGHIAKGEHGHRSRKKAAHVVVVGRQHTGKHK